MQVVDKNYQGITVKNENGLQWQIGKDIVEKECYSNDQFNEEKVVSRTELIEIFSQTGDAVFTVNYDKQPKAEDFLELTRQEGKVLSFEEMTKRFKKFKGENRTLIGYTTKVENGFGRSLVVDLQAENSDRMRLVDHRTLNWLIFKNVRYVVK